MGQLGSGYWEPTPPGRSGFERVPAPVRGGIRFGRLSAREYQTCGVTLEDGKLYCWGYGQSGQTGDSAVVADCNRSREPARPCSSLAPVRVLPESLPGERVEPAQLQFAQVAAGGRLACAASVAGMAYCWGDNYRCALGRCKSGPSTLGRYIPVPGRVVEIGAGNQFACARTADGRIYCWGDNSYAQLGSLVSVNTGPDGLPPDYRDSTQVKVWSAAHDDPCFRGGRCSPAAAEIDSPHRWSALAVGQDHACALARDDGGIYCWGGTDPRVLGRDGFPITCVNRSFGRPNKRCQPSPIRVPGLPALAPAAALSAELKAPTARDPLSNTLVEVSTQLARITFPIDTTGTWSWPSRSGGGIEGYVWSAVVNGMDGPASIGAWVYRDTTALALSSLESLIMAGYSTLCLPGMTQGCRNEKVNRAVVSHRVTLTLDDPRLIRRLFGTRPTHVRVMRQMPGKNNSAYQSDSVAVLYVAPQVPLPDSVIKAEAASGRRKYEASIRSIHRTIKGLEWGNELWLAVGDSMKLEVEEIRCVYDNCGQLAGQVSDAGWSARDTAVVQIRTSSDGERFAHARRTGQTTIRVQGLRGPADTMLSKQQPERSIEQQVTVGRPLARLEILPRPDTVLVGEAYTFGARAFDTAGRVVPGVPIRILVENGQYGYGMTATQPYPAEFKTSGLHSVVATFGRLADTLVVTAVDPTRH